MPDAAISSTVERASDVSAAGGIGCCGLELADALRAVDEESSAAAVKSDRGCEGLSRSAAAAGTPAAIADRLVIVNLASEAVAETEVPIDVDSNGYGTEAAGNLLRLFDRAEEFSFVIEND